MKNQLLSIGSLILFSLFIYPHQAASTETAAGKLITSLNSKTAKIEYKVVLKNKDQSIKSKMIEVNSYIFSLDKQRLKVEINEEIREYQNDKVIGKNVVVGTIAMDPGQIDPEKIAIEREVYMNIFCRDSNGRCMDREDHVTINRPGFEKPMEKDRKFKAVGFQILGATQPLSGQILADLKKLFTLLAPPPVKPPEKNITAPAVTKNNANL